MNYSLEYPALEGKLIAEVVAGTAERFNVVARLALQPFPAVRCCSARAW